MFPVYDLSTAMLINMSKMQQGKTLSLMAAKYLRESDCTTALKCDFDATEKEMHATFAVEKKLDEDTTLKFKIEEDLDIDVAIKMRLSPGVSLTLCFGMDLAEKTRKGRAKIKKELEEDNEDF